MNAELSINIGNLKFNYFIHLFLFALIIFFNFILLYNIFWTNYIFYILFIMCIVFDIIYFIFPIIVLIFITLKKFKTRIIDFFRKITFIFCIIEIIIGLIFVIAVLITTIQSPNYNIDCPFNIPFSYFKSKFNDKSDNSKKIKEECLKRKCMLYNKNLENIYQYEYICNYDPTSNFDKKGPFTRTKSDGSTVTSDSSINCKIINIYQYENVIIYNYFSTCNDYISFYYCKRFDEPKHYNIISNNYTCPYKNYMRNIITFCVVNFCINLILSFVPWKTEYNIYKKIILSSTVNNNRLTPNSMNKTNNSSKIIKENENENKQEEGFKKEPTEIIIVSNMKKGNSNDFNEECFNRENNTKDSGRELDPTSIIQIQRINKK